MITNPGPFAKNGPGNIGQLPILANTVKLWRQLSLVPSSAKMSIEIPALVDPNQQQQKIPPLVSEQKVAPRLLQYAEGVCTVYTKK